MLVAVCLCNARNEKRLSGDAIPEYAQTRARMIIVVTGHAIIAL